MRRLLPLSLGTLVIIGIPLVAFSLVHASPGPRAPAHWSAARNVSNSDGLVAVAGPRIGVDDNGYLHLTWIDDKAGSGDLYYTKSTDAGTNWSAFEPITTTFESWPGDMAIGPDGAVHAAWVEVEGTRSNRIEYAYRAGDGNWNVSTVADVAFQLDPAIAVDGNYIYVVWQKRVELGNPNIWYSYKAITDTNWAVVPQLITDTLPSSFAPDLAMDSNGNVHLVWQEQVNDGAICYSEGSWSGTLNWSPVITVSQSLTGCATPAIAVGSDDYVHIVWGQMISKEEQYVYYAGFPHHITPTKVFTEAIGVSTEAPTYLYPRVAIRGDSELHLVWHGKGATDSTDQIWYAVSEDKGSNWSSPIKISQEPARQALSPDIALDEEMGHVVWQGKDEEGKYQVMYSRGFPYAVYLPVIIKGF